MSAISCVDVSKVYGGVAAVDGVSIDVPGRGVYGLCGFNGAGKSTLFNLLAGSVSADRGSVHITGRDVTHLSASQRARLGVARTWQLVRLAKNRSVLDNVAAGALAVPGQSLVSALFGSQLRDARGRAEAALDRLGIGDLRGALVGNLTLESQRLTELARALASDPVVVLADEPASGLSVGQRQELGKVLSEMGESLTVVLVEHDIDMLMAISRHVWTMDQGKIAFSGDVPAFAKSPVYGRLRGLSETAEIE